MNTTTDTTDIRNTTLVHGTTGSALGWGTKVRGRFSRLAVIAAVAVSAFAGSVAVLPSSSASAATWVRYGTYGGVTLQPVVGQNVTKAKNGTITAFPGLAINGPYVTRSQATSGAQTVWFEAKIERWHGDRWIYYGTTGLRGYTIAAGQQGLWIPNTYYQTGSGSYRISSLALYWRDASNRNLGSFAAVYDSAADYRCRIAWCAVGPGYVTI